MKKHLRFTPFLFVITSFLSFQPLLSQTNNWAPIGAVWHYDAFGHNFCFFPWFEGYFTMESVRDTQMLGKTVRVIERRHGGGLKIQERDFLMYEDSGKVYYYHDSLAQFMLLYDFEAMVGDTLVLRTDTANYGGDYYGSFFVAISHIQPYSQVECRLYSLTGQQVKTWARQMDNQGNWRGMVPTHELAPGSYLATLLLEGQQKAAKLVVVR